MTASSDHPSESAAFSRPATGPSVRRPQLLPARANRRIVPRIARFRRRSGDSVASPSALSEIDDGPRYVSVGKQQGSAFQFPGGLEPSDEGKP
jgi:hypothetical protein